MYTKLFCRLTSVSVLNVRIAQDCVKRAGGSSWCKKDKREARGLPSCLFSHLNELLCYSLKTLED
jgi:hypothetical protein